MLKKYTHIVEKCSGFLRAGVSVRLKRHSYTMSEAYWRLREGKGLVSAYDQETLDLLSQMITQFRRRMGLPIAVRTEDYLQYRADRDRLIKHFDEFRDIVVEGVKPEYLHNNHYVVAIERVLMRRIGKEYFELSDKDYIRFWQSLELDEVQDELYKEDSQYEQEMNWYKSLSEEEKKMTIVPGSDVGFKYDKIWQIRTDMEHRSSVNAGINLRLNYIWDIPNNTTEEQRETIKHNLAVINDWVVYKDKIKDLKNKGGTVYKELVTSKYETIIAQIQMFDFNDIKNNTSMID